MGKKKDKKYVESLKSWIEERKLDLNYSMEQFDKLIIALSSGGLILTIGFVRDIIKITEETNTNLLKSCWYLLTLALISNLIGQMCAFLANKLEINITQIEISSYETKKEYNENQPQIKRKRYLFHFANYSIKILNALSFLSLVIGIILFIIFVNHNI